MVSVFTASKAMSVWFGAVQLTSRGSMIGSGENILELSFLRLGNSIARHGSCAVSVRGVMLESLRVY